MSARPGTLSSTSVIAGLLGLASTLTAGITHAQTATTASADTLEEIVVTAERRTEDIQKAGTSVSVRSGEDMLNQGKFSLKSILEDIPGITGGAAFATGGTGGGGTDTPASGLVIRGIPSNSGAGGSTTSTAPAAAIYVDGVYNGVGGGYDIDRVEALRGPQGTLYGRSATAGLVAIHTHNPELDAVGGSATIEAGNYNLRHYTAVLNLPILNDVLGVRVAGNRYQQDGFIDAEAGATQSTDGKVKVLYKPNDDISLLVGVAAQNNVEYSGGRAIGTNDVGDGPQKVKYVNIPVKGKLSNNFRQYWAELNWNLGFGTLTYQPAFRSWTQDGTLYINGVLGAGAQPLSTPKDDFMTNELRLSSNPDSKLIWQVGALHYDNKLENSNAVFFTVPPSPPGMVFSDAVNKHTEAVGVFAQATYPVAEAWRVTAGLRYDKTKVTQTENYQLGQFLAGPNPPPPLLVTGDAGKRTFSNLTYKLRLEHDLSADSLLYASISTGFSPGDVTVAAQCPVSVSATSPCPIELKAETLRSYEIGSKNRFLDDTLQVNGGVFYSKYGAFQSAGINVNENPGPPTFAPLNTPLVSYGVEFETLYKFTAADLLGFNLGWTVSKYVDKPADFAHFVAEDQVTSTSGPGSAAPIPFSATLSYQHIFI
jgi:iron complex outermembrane receptor protein